MMSLNMPAFSARDESFKKGNDFVNFVFYLLTLNSKLGIVYYK